MIIFSVSQMMTAQWCDESCDIRDGECNPLWRTHHLLLRISLSPPVPCLGVSRLLRTWLRLWRHRSLLRPVRPRSRYRREGARIRECTDPARPADGTLAAGPGWLLVQVSYTALAPPRPGQAHHAPAPMLRRKIVFSNKQMWARDGQDGDGWQPGSHGTGCGARPDWPQPKLRLPGAPTTTHNHNHSLSPCCYKDTFIHISICTET